VHGHRDVLSFWATVCKTARPLLRESGVLGALLSSTAGEIFSQLILLIFLLFGVLVVAQ